ncbi:MAG: fibronectin type III domain-containing protein [Actinomycetota bacterium]
MARAGLPLLLAIVMVVGGMPNNASAALIAPDTPDATWQTGGKSSSDYSGSRVNSIAVTSDRYYLGGAFLNVRPPNGAFGSGNVARNRLAAFDSSGALTSWNPNANGTVNAVAVDPGSGTVFVGGNFSSIGGRTHPRLAAIDPVSGQPLTWNPAPNGEVTGLLIANGRLYVGGRFTTMAGATRTRLAAFDLPGLTLNNTWRPTADSTVTSLATLDGSTIFVGGFFTSISGDSAQQHLAALDPVNASIKPLAAHPPYYIEGITPTATQLFVAEGGPGGKVQAFSWPAGSLQWTAQFDGDMQALVARDGIVYAGGHQLAYCVGGTGAGAPFVCDRPTTRRKFAALDATSGALTSWDPDSNGPLGVFDLEATPTGLVAGGEFSIVHGRRQQGFARFTAGTTSDALPSVPQNLTGSVDPDGTTIHLTWDASTDDFGIDHYAVYRTDVSSSTPIGTSLTPDYGDTGLATGTTYQYRVRAVDSIGQPSGLSSPFSLTTPGIGPPPAFSDNFEGGTMAAWTSSTRITVEPSIGFGGTYGAHAHPSNTTAFAQKQLGAASSTVTFEDHFDILSQGDNWIDLIKFRNTAGAVIATLSVDRLDQLQLRLPSTGASFISSTVATRNAWHDVVLKVTVAGSSGMSEVWLDGVQVAELSVTANFGTNQISTLQLGDSSSRTYDIVYDDVAVSS